MDCVEVGILVLTFVQAQLFSALFSWKLRLPSPSVLAPTGWVGSGGEGGGAQMLVCVFCMVSAVSMYGVPLPSVYYTSSSLLCTFLCCVPCLLCTFPCCVDK